MTQQPPHQRNGEIELARFLVALVIVNYHSGSFPGCPQLFGYGQIGVEFFFLLSGLLMASSIRKKENLPISSFREVNRETAHFLWRKLSSFYPELVISCILGCIFFACVHHADPIIMTVGKTIRTFTANICLLETSGFGNYGINGVTWYLASMMLSMAILYPLYRWVGLNTIFPAICLVLLSPFFMGGGDKIEIAFLVGRANIRAFCEIVLGASLFPVVMAVRRFDLRRWMRACLTLVKMGCYAIFLIYAVRSIPPNGGGNGLVLIALILIIVLSFSRVGLDADLYQHRCIFWLGRLSLPLFLSHLFYTENLNLDSPDIDNFSRVANLLFYNVCSLATAVLVMYLAQFVRRFFKEHRNLFLRSSAPAVEKQG